MPTFKNVSSTESFYPVVLTNSSYNDINTGIDPSKSIDTLISPNGEESINPPHLSHRRYYVYLFDKRKSLFWSGRLFPDDTVKIDPINKTVLWEDIALEMFDLQSAKDMNIIDVDISEKLLADLKNHAINKGPDAAHVAIDPNKHARVVRDQGYDLGPCVLAWGDVGINIVSMALNVQSVYNRYNEEDRINLVQNMYNRLANGQFVEMLQEEFIDAGVHLRNRNYGEFLKSIGKIAVRLKAGIIDIIRDILAGLDLLDVCLYGALLAGELLAAAGTEGASIVAGGVMVFFSDTLFLYQDIENAIETCKSNPDLPPDSQILLDYISSGKPKNSFPFGEHAYHEYIHMAAGFNLNSNAEIKQIILGGLRLQRKSHAVIKIELKDGAPWASRPLHSWTKVIDILERIEFVAGAQGEISDIVVVSAW